MPKLTLQFGHNDRIPENATAAWGARLIFPDDLLPDRQDFAGMDTPDGQRLKAWLNGEKALRKALEQAAKLASRCAISKDGSSDVTLYEDATGCIIGNPRRSFGYLYVVAFLKEADSAAA